MKPLSLETNDNGEMKCSLVLPSRGIKLIGVRFYPCTSKNKYDLRKTICMQKNLYASKEWLYFNKGFKVFERKEKGRIIPKVTRIEVETNAFDSSFLLYSGSVDVTIGFSAIIGQNGTGKSTIVDTIIRLINNLSAAIIGENYVYSSAHHLHYIENVYAALAVYIDSKIKILTCLGGKLYVTTYEADPNVFAHSYRRERKVIEKYKCAFTTTILKGNEPKDELLPPQDKFRHVLQDWFYSLVGNYSLYAYNYRDYEYERTDVAKLEKLRVIKPDDNNEDDEFWLKGVFHKNDGYQTPVVIHPMRNNGYVNTARVNFIGKQNLISLAFVKENGAYNFPFRIINKTHKLVAFYFYHEDFVKYKGFLEGIISEKLNPDDKQRERFSAVELPIKHFWAGVLGISYKASTQNTMRQRAWDYVAYKTIKILGNYNQYKDAWDSLMGNNYQVELTKHLGELMKDSTHRTLKLRRALAFLRFENDSDYYLKKSEVVDLDTIYLWMEAKINMQLYPNNDYHPLTIEDLLPPPYPIVDVVLQLVDNEHYKEYKDIGNKSLHIIPFGGLSSGERQIAYTIGNILYHLKNLESGKQDLNVNRDHATAIKYDYVNIMLDEVELYFHPDLQRRFISLLLGAVKGLRLENIRGINVLLVTHSPFVLSDIPSENILCLSRNKEDKLEGKTFAANIHDLFNNTFFLPYTVGELAKEEIEKIVSLYQNCILTKHNKDSWCVMDKAISEVDNSEWARMRYIASVVGDDYLHDELTDMLDEIEEHYQIRADYEES